MAYFATVLLQNVTVTLFVFSKRLISRYLFINFLLIDDTFILLDNGELYEGDIKLDPLTRLYMEVDRNLPPRRKRAIARDRTKRWEGGVIPYVIDRKLRKYLFLVLKSISRIEVVNSESKKHVGR